jgi:glutamate 5-kinase
MIRFDPDNYTRLVVKIGSALLTDADGRVNRRWLGGVADDVAALRTAGKDVLVVSSGAIAIGSGILGVTRRRARLDELQAAAAAGQVRLVHAWQEALAVHDIAAAQVLLTLGDTEDRRRWLNARGTLSRLLAHGVVPVINENDTVATEEIRYGDNDRLAARVAQMVMADCLLLLSDVDGLYSADPNRQDAAVHVPRVEAITDEIIAMAGSSRSEIGSGGMATKLVAARIATYSGCATLVASGAVERPIAGLIRGARHTVFRPRGTPAAARKQWLAGAWASPVSRGNSLAAIRCRSRTPTAASSAADWSATTATRPHVSPAAAPKKSPRAWAIPAARPWCTATISFSSGVIE